MKHPFGPDGSIWASLAKDWDKEAILAKREGTNWVAQSYYSAAVAVDPAGMPWFANRDGVLFRGITEEVIRLSTPVVHDGKVEFSFPTVSGANYVVQVWRDLGLPWTELQSVAGTGSPVTVTDTPPSEARASFYAVSKK
jgi:hypothetical protein